MHLHFLFYFLYSGGYEGVMPMTESEKQTPANDNSIYYILGGVVLVAAIAGFFLLKPKGTTTPTTTPTTGQAQEVATPTPGPITGLACERQYYNPRIGYPEYYLSVEGVDTNTSGKVTCDYSVSVKDKVVKTASATGDLSEAPGRGGGSFRCITDAVQLAKGIPSKVDIKLTGPDNKTATCSQTFVFP